MVPSRAQHWVRQAVDFLPKGHSLPEDAWRVRHRTAVAEAGIIAVFAAVGWGSTGPGRRRQFSSAVIAVGLVVSSAVLVHLSGGIIEMHFHFFVMVGILTLYQDWVPFLLAVGFVVAHHGLAGALVPGKVYNHPDAVAHPFKWALIHGLSCSPPAPPASSPGS